MPPWRAGRCVVLRRLAAELGDVSFSAVRRIWRKHGVRPHRLDTHMVSNDPDFETKAADVIGLYLDPPAHAAVFCVDEKTAIQALDRKDRMLPLSPGRAESHGFEYKRNSSSAESARQLPHERGTRDALGCPLRSGHRGRDRTQGRIQRPFPLRSAVSCAIRRYAGPSPARPAVGARSSTCAARCAGLAAQFNRTFANGCRARIGCLTAGRAPQTAR